MLKLEKTSQQSGLIVRLREKERFFESRLLIALSLALIIHLGGLLLFHVTPFSFTSSYLFPPVKVQSSHPVQGIAAFADPIENEEELSPPTPGLIPSLEIALLNPPSSMLASHSLNPDAFQQIEEHLWPIEQPPLALDLTEPRIRLHISGHLAEQRLIESDPLLQETLPIHVKASPAFVSYQARMNEQTGELYWLEKTGSSGNPSVDKLAEKIAFHLRFEPTNALDALEGTLTFAFLIPEERP